VTGNNARFTRKEGAAAEVGKDLLSKFAHGSWKGVTDQVERGIKNLPIAGADMRRAKTIWKLTEASMKDNRGTDSVGGGLKKFLFVARGRGFDTKCIRTDGEGAIAALTVDLEKDHGLVVEPTASGTHVEEIERMSSQTLKKRIRCHFHDLPFVMSKIMLKKNAVFCARGINMVASRTSGDKVSPLKQFTGRKIDAKIVIRRLRSSDQPE
jgi:hypothetical protein